MSWRLDISLPDLKLAERPMAVFEGAVADPELLKRVGMKVRHAVVEHLEGLPPNKQFPGQTTGFYKDAANSVHDDVVGDSSAVSINHLGMRQRLLGGTIRPVKAEFLPIPVREEAYGKSPRDPYWADKLRLASLPGVGLVLVEREFTALKIGRKRKDGSQSVKSGGAKGGAIMYKLVKEVHQDPDPSVVPSRERIAEIAGEAASDFIAERLNSKG